MTVEPIKTELGILCGYNVRDETGLLVGYVVRTVESGRRGYTSFRIDANGSTEVARCIHPNEALLPLLEWHL